VEADALDRGAMFRKSGSGGTAVGIGTGARRLGAAWHAFVGIGIALENEIGLPFDTTYRIACTAQ
jgi:hypothetical protein